MNALELADELESCRDYELPEFVHKTATMLRQLQKSNEALADEYAIYVNEVCKLTYEIEKKNTLLKMWEASHPVKELTQGEIHAVWASGSYYTLDKEGNVDEVRFEDFARAILKKVSEK